MWKMLSKEKTTTKKKEGFEMRLWNDNKLVYSIVERPTEIEQKYLLLSRGKKLHWLRQRKLGCMVSSDYTQANVYRKWIQRMMDDKELVLDSNGVNISHLVLPNGVLMNKVELDIAAWKQEVNGLSEEKYILAKKARLGIVQARARRRKTIAAGKKVNESNKYSPSMLEYRIPTPIDEGAK